jgi:RHS repeat-associated protein
MAGGGMLGNRWATANTEIYLVNETSAIELIYTASSKFVFPYVSGSYLPPASRPLTLEHKPDADEYWVTNTETGALAIFHDFTITATDDRGKLKEFTSVAMEAEGKSGILYSRTYVAGSLASLTVTTSGEQACSVTSVFANNRLTTLSLADAGELTKNVEYVYFDDVTAASSQAGSAGDLVHVKVSQRAPGDPTAGPLSIVNHTLYRYGSSSRVKGVYEHAAVMRALSHFSESDPQWLLKQDDDVQSGGTGPDIADFASRWFTYYSSDATTSSISTVWTPMGSENLHSTYGGTNRNESGFVASERIGACAACGGSGAGGTREYYYLEIDQGTTNDDNEVKYLVVEDTKDSDGPQFRKIFGLDLKGRKLREVFIDNPTSSPQYWCHSWKLVSTGEYTSSPKKRHHIAEYRPPSAHNVTSSNVDEFLDPFDDDGSGSWANDTATLRAASDSTAGPTYVYTYNTEGRQTDKQLKRGHDSTNLYYLSATDYGGGGVPAHLPTTIYQYPAKTTTRGDSSSVQWTLAYEFWDTAKTQLRKVTTTHPIVSTGQNGSGVAASDEVWYDKVGRLRWEKDAEGYVTYYSYHKTTGKLGYVAVDVNPASAPSGATDSTWVSWNEDGDGGGTYDSADIPTRDGTLPTALALVTRQEFDSQGRPTLFTNPGGDRHYTLYESDRRIEFSYLDGNGMPQMPTRISVADIQGKTAEAYSIRGNYTAISVTNGVPTGFSTQPDQDDYVSWTKYAYDEESGDLSAVDTYHDIPAQGGGPGTISTNFDRTAYLYDKLGRRTHTIQQVSGAPTSGGDGVEQITQVVYDKLGRVQESIRGVSNAAHNMGAEYDAFPTTLVTVSKTFYDGANDTSPLAVGDGHVTSTIQYHTVDGNGDPDDYTLAEYKRTYRGHLRGMEQLANGTTLILPVAVQDVDWEGRATGSAQYATTLTWSSVLTGDGYADYTTTTSGRNDWIKIYFDALGNVYRTEEYPGTSNTSHFENNNFYDRNGRLVASGQKHSAHMEYAYDGAGRQYQNRTVTDVAATCYSGGKFQYRAPAPHPALASMSTTGDDGLIEFSHSVFDDCGDVIEEHTFELNHTDTDGIDIDANDSYVRHTMFSWYDAACRLSATADYGAGDGTSGITAWAYSTRPSRPSEPTWTDSIIYDGYALLTKFGYHAESGRMDTVIMGTSKSGSDTDTTTTKTFYDDLSRQTFVSENYDDFSPPATGIGDTSDSSQDRVTGWVYNGLGQVIKLTAHNGATEQQVTDYSYLDNYDASLVTHTIYPDATSRTAETTFSAAADQVRVEYALDGLPERKKDQRDVVIEYSYNNARRLALEAATTIPSGVDNAVQSIGRTYDSLGRPEKVTSYPNDDGTGTPVNEVEYAYYNTFNRLYRIYQAHAGAVSTSTTPRVQFSYDADNDSGVYSDGLRMNLVDYPAATNAKMNISFNNDDTIDDRLHRERYRKPWGGDLNGNAPHTTYYQYNGTGRIAGVFTHDTNTNLKREMFSASGNYDSFDRFGREVKFAWQNRSTNAVLDQVDYTYDYAGNRLTRNVRVDLINGTYPDTRDYKYEYDGLHRLKNALRGTYNTSTAAIDSRNLEQDWTLDQLGNWPTFKERDTDTGSSWDLDQERYHNAVNEILEINSTSGTDWADPVQDAAGNMTTIPSPHSPASSFSLKYDAWNRLVEVRDDTNITVQLNEYDGLGQRIKRTDVTPEPDGFYEYYYNDQWQLLTEVRGGTVEAIYQWNPFYIDALAVRMTASKTLFFLQDANFNVTAAVDDNGNAVAERYAYTPYGEVTVLDADFAADADGVSDIANQHLYTGRERDSETGLQLNRHRYYAPHVSRWISRDLINYEDGFNLYSYVGDAPLAYFDSSGLAQECDLDDACTEAVVPPFCGQGVCRRGQKCEKSKTDRHKCACSKEEEDKKKGKCFCFVRGSPRNPDWENHYEYGRCTSQKECNRKCENKGYRYGICSLR